MRSPPSVESRAVMRPPCAARWPRRSRDRGRCRHDGDFARRPYGTAVRTVAPDRSAERPDAVIQAQVQRLRFGSPGDFDAAWRRSVAHAVLQQVAEQLLDPRSVPAHRNLGFERRARSQRQARVFELSRMPLQHAGRSAWHRPRQNGTAARSGPPSPADGSFTSTPRLTTSSRSAVTASGLRGLTPSTIASISPRRTVSGVRSSCERSASQRRRAPRCVAGFRPSH